MKLPKFKKPTLEDFDTAPVFILSQLLIVIPLLVLVMYAYHKVGLPSLMQAAA